MGSLDVFTYGNQPVRTLTIQGEPWFVLADLTKVLGLSQYRADRLDDDVIRNHPIVDRLGRTQQAAIVAESGMYEVVLRSDKPEAKQFRWWLTHDVLPAIRKTGRYGSDVDMLAALPSSKLLALAAEAAERAEELQAKITADAPKVLFADAVATSEDSILVARLAGILKQNGTDIGQNRLFERLRAEGYLCKGGESYNRPTQRSLDLGLFEVIERTVQGSSDTPRLTFTTKVTGKGQQYFIDRYASRKAVA